jgi:hypothetical protein
LAAPAGASGKAANLMQQIAERVLDVLLRFRRRAVKSSWFSMKCISSFVALRQMLVHDQGIVDHLDVRYDAEAGIGLV